MDFKKVPGKYHLLAIDYEIQVWLYNYVYYNYLILFSWLNNKICVDYVIGLMRKLHFNLYISEPYKT